ncbi:MAG: two-component system, cell cycle sensor histidine kinase and response regulator CckA [Chloroflexota bacterium]|jgi:CheY-like chemotaxis protein|nr:two-component system, cell cycle sensor histidine kinase and response regulator CckA [Chloroflexota bacterium]
MTDKRKDSRNNDPASMALEAANQALAAANAAVNAAVKALSLASRRGNNDEGRRGRGSIRNAASQARRRLANEDDDSTGVAPLASAAPAPRAPARRGAAPKAAPKAGAQAKTKAVVKPKAAPKPRAVAKPKAAAPPVAPPPPAPPPGTSFTARKRAGAFDAPPEIAPPSRGRAGMRKVMTESMDELPPHALPTESQPLSRDNRAAAEAPASPEVQAKTRPSGSGPIILGSGAGARVDAPTDQAAAAPPAAGPTEAELREQARRETELREREAELAEREAAMARYTPMEPAHAVPAKPPVEENGYTVLVVDDEEQVRALTVRILSRFGYRVLEASGVELALSILDEDTSNVDLVLSDVAMPGLSGKDLFRAISESRPGLPVVFMSGYALGVYAPEGLIEEGVKMLPKPFGQEDLLDFVTEALQGAAAR